MNTPTTAKGESTLSHLLTSILYTIVTVIALGLIYPLAITGIGMLVFPHQANGSYVENGGKVVGSKIIGQLWTKPENFQGPAVGGRQRV